MAMQPVSTSQGSHNSSSLTPNNSNQWRGRKVTIFYDRLLLRALFRERESFLGHLPLLGPCQMVEKYVFPLPTPGIFNSGSTASLICVKKKIPVHQSAYFIGLA